ncbi:uncharacterized protein LTR77_008714 [Saxophila tyrrhenica]|uniref:Rhodopsin domain-containing protein n=1 Tax=Saxophila tyrrhenica TaxID=1690608 RepID=A0AAV9P3R4_9PEZI|nr:hypothetical protein LTR77_008714 [Saxophila tyrrhenica]
MPAITPRFTPAKDTPHCQQSNVGEVLGVTGAFMAAATITMVLRSYVRIHMLKFFGPDDWMMLAAVLMAIATFICFVGETTHGVGRHADCIPLPEVEGIMKWQFYHNLWNMFGVVFVKISIALFLIRLAPKKAWKWFLWGCIVFLTAFCLACAGTLIFSCVPVSAAWNFAEQATAKCFSNDTFSSIGLFNSIINIATDFLFALIPIPIIYKLQVNTRTKVTLAVILSLGLVACASAIVKAHLQTTFLTDQDRFWHDGFMVWNMIELCLGVLAASLPALKPLFNAFFQSTKTALGLSGSRSKASGHGPAGIVGSNGYKRYGSSRDVDDMMGHNVAFHEMKSPRSTLTSKNDIEVTREIEVDVDTYPIRGKESQGWEQPWRQGRYS